MRTSRIELVRKVLANNAEIRDWYASEHHVTADDMNYQSVLTYGSGFHGDLADMIIEDGIRAGVITQAETEADE